MKTKRLFALLLVVALLLPLMACGGSGGAGSSAAPSAPVSAGADAGADSAADSGADATPITVTFYSPNSGNFASQALTVMAQQLTEKSGGLMTGNVIEAGTAGTQDEAAQMMMSNDLQVIVYTVDQMSNQVPGAGDWLSLPFLFDSEQQAATDYEQGWMLEKVKELAAVGNIHVFDYVYSGFKCISFTKPVHSYADWQNLKVRVPNNPMFHDLCGAYGMQTVAGIDMYTSMQNGTVDAVLQGEEGHQVFKLEEVMMELVQIHDTYGSNFYVCNEPWFQSLSADQQQLLNEVITEVSAEYNQKSKDAITEYVEVTLPANNVELVVPDTEWKNAMKKAVIPVWEAAFANPNYNAELMERLKAEYYEVNFADVL